MPPELTVEIQKVPLDRGHVLGVILQGNFVWSSPVEVDRMVLEQVEDDTRGVFVDFSAVGIIDSRGLGILTSLSAKLIRKKVGFVLVGVSSRIEDMFAASRLTGVFINKRSQQDALDYLASLGG